MLYETEEQQVEALKQWWKENGTSVIAGVVIGLIGVFGWRAWTNHRNTVAAQASNLFDQLVMSVETGKADVAASQATLLRSDYESTPYAAFAELMEARMRYEQGDIMSAKEALRQAIEKAPDAAFATMGVLRLARLQISAGEYEAATDLLTRYPAPPAFAAEYAALRGDIARAQGDIEEARQAYQQALAGKVGNTDLVQLKLDNLPPSS